VVFIIQHNLRIEYPYLIRTYFLAVVALQNAHADSKRASNRPPIWLEYLTPLPGFGFAGRFEVILRGRQLVRVAKDRICRDCGHVVRRARSTKCSKCGGYLRVKR